MLPVRMRLGVFEVDLRIGELREGERTVLLQEQPFRILQMLIERGGEMVTREEIKKKFWPNDTVVEFDHSINAAIGKLRRALDDSADDPRYIETIARRGYRLIVPVEWVVGAKGSPAHQAAQVADAAGLASVNQPDSGTPSGRTVSHYRVLDIIGGGGMGVVYRAEDLKLGRAVALKFLPEELGSDPQALERFSHEARAASLLDHANICPIFEFGEHEGRPFLVMQLLEGQTLRDHLAASDVSLPLAEMLDIGIQISDGLQASHERGVIHRDIKPANIFITDKGVCKILDFGVAKLLEIGDEGELAVQPATPAAPSPTPAVGSVLTRTDIALGTAGYMSPEQVRGERLDAGTDLFSFGLVLYEMATGRRAFSGETAQIVRDAIVHQPRIPVHDLNSKIPPELEAIINKALEKDRQARYQTAAEMAADLKGLRRGAEPLTQKPAPYRLAVLLALVPLIVLIGLGWWLNWFRGQQVIPGKVLTERQLTHNPSEIRVTGAAISPDGKYLAYVDPKGLHLSVIETAETHDVPLPENLRNHLLEVTWFPDGDKLLFTAGTDADGHTMWSISVFGGPPRKLGNGSDSAGAVISPRSSGIAFVGGNEDEIWLMGPDGENPHKILTGKNERYAAVTWSPTGERLAYIRGGVRAGGSIGTISLEGAPPSEVISDIQIANTSGPYLFWARDGRLIFVSYEVGPLQGQNLWEIVTAPVTGKPSGRAAKITNWDGLAIYSPTASKDANRLAVVKLHVRTDIYVGELEDGGRRLAPPTRLTVSDSVNQGSGWMRDGKTILFSSDRAGRRQILRQGMEQDTAEPLITGPGYDRDAELSPDGRWILYWSISTPVGSSRIIRRLMRFPASGGAPEQVLEAKIGDYDYFDCPIRPDSSCVFIHWEGGQSIFYALDPIQGRGNELGRTKFGSTAGLNWSVSPEGSRIAVGGRGKNGEGQVRILNFRNGAEHNLKLPHGWRLLSLSWTADGNALLATALSTGYLIARIEFDGQTRVLLNREPNQGLGYICPSPDGIHLAFSQETRESNAWLLENF